MTKYLINIISVLFLLLAWNLIASENRLKAMGEITYSVPDLNSQVNLFQVAQNSALLKNNDTTNWMYYRTESVNNWGDLKRNWDAYKNQSSVISFSGQKHLDKTKIFYGDIRYNWDYRNNVDFAIEKNPYGFDPFVLADYTTGSILFRGPEIFVAYNHLISKSFYWGLSVNYNINRGLKDISSEVEIINRSIRASVDVIYNIDENNKIGLSFSPYQIQDITKLVTQKDGLDPTVRRYRGEYEYRERTGTSDRTADYDGFEIKPQFSFRSEFIEHVDYFSYYYQWHHLYDGTSSRKYDGYFQAQHIGFNSLTRINISSENSSYVMLAYGYQKYDDWAKEPLFDLLINRVLTYEHNLKLGGSSKISNLPLILAIEMQYEYLLPHQIDYLAQKNRKGKITTLQIKSGMEYSLSEQFSFRGGLIYSNYNEDEIWNYFHDYSGYKLTYGVGWQFNKYELDVSGNYMFNQNNVSHLNNQKRKGIDLLIQLKQYLN